MFCLYLVFEKGTSASNKERNCIACLRFSLFPSSDVWLQCSDINQNFFGSECFNPVQKNCDEIFKKGGNYYDLVCNAVIVTCPSPVSYMTLAVCIHTECVVGLYSNFLIFSLHVKVCKLYNHICIWLKNWELPTLFVRIDSPICISFCGALLSGKKGRQNVIQNYSSKNYYPTVLWLSMIMICITVIRGKYMTNFCRVYQWAHKIEVQ